MPFPHAGVDDILPELGKTKIFTKVDCKDGYRKIKLTEESFLLTTFVHTLAATNVMVCLSGFGPVVKYFSFDHMKQLKAFKEYMGSRM